MKWLIGTITFCFLLSACNQRAYTYEAKNASAANAKSASRSISGMPNEPGKCYAKCLLNDGSTSDWKEVLCEKQITKSLAVKIHKILGEQGYQVGPEPTSKKFGAQLKGALMKFQRDNDYPLGQLDVETLEGLGVDY